MPGVAVISARFMQTHFMNPEPHCRDGTAELGEAELLSRTGCTSSDSYLLLSLLKTTWPARWLFKASLPKKAKGHVFLSRNIFLATPL